MKPLETHFDLCPGDSIEEFIANLNTPDAATEDRESTSMALNTMGRILFLRSKFAANKAQAQLMNQACFCFAQSAKLSGFGVNTYYDGIDEPPQLPSSDDDSDAEFERKLLQSHEKMKMSRRTSHQKSLLSRSSGWVTRGTIAHASCILTRGCHTYSIEDITASQSLISAVSSFLNIHPHLSDSDPTILPSIQEIGQLGDRVKSQIANETYSNDIVPCGHLPTSTHNSNRLLTTAAMLYEGEMLVLGVFSDGLLRRWSYEKDAAMFVFKREQKTNIEISSAEFCACYGVVVFITSVGILNIMDWISFDILLKLKMGNATKKLFLSSADPTDPTDPTNKEGATKTLNLTVCTSDTIATIKCSLAFDAGGWICLGCVGSAEPLRGPSHELLCIGSGMAGWNINGKELAMTILENGEGTYEVKQANNIEISTAVILTATGRTVTGYVDGTIVCEERGNVLFTAKESDKMITHLQLVDEFTFLSVSANWSLEFRDCETGCCKGCWREEEEEEEEDEDEEVEEEEEEEHKFRPTAVTISNIRNSSKANQCMIFLAFQDGSIKNYIAV